MKKTIVSGLVITVIGAVMLAFGIGLIVGHCLESWFLCCCGGVGLIVLGFCVMRRR